MKNNETRSDAALVARALTGRPEAFGPIVERYSEAVFAVALARLGRFHDAEDVAQAVFVDAFASLTRLREAEKLGPWLRTMAINKSIDVLRARKPQVALDQAEGPAAQAMDRDAAVQADLKEAVLAAIGKLGKAQRETVTLFYINGYTITDVAGMQGVAEGTVKARLHHARKRLKEEMIGMVEDVLKSEAPKEGFAERVFELLNMRATGPGRPYAFGRYRETVAELQRIGGQGVEGFLRALESPHGATRVHALHMLQAHHAAQADEQVIAALKRALGDTNKKARRHAFEALMGAEVLDERKRSEFIPLAVPLLLDKSKRVRRAVSWELCRWPGETPTATVAAALLNEKDDHTRQRLQRLMRAVLKARGNTTEN